MPATSSGRPVVGTTGASVKTAMLLVVATSKPGAVIVACTLKLPASAPEPEPDDALNQLGSARAPEQARPTCEVTLSHGRVVVAPVATFVITRLTGGDALNRPKPGADVHTYATTWSLRSYTVGVRSTMCSVSWPVDAAWNTEEVCVKSAPAMLVEYDIGPRWCSNVTERDALPSAAGERCRLLPGDEEANNNAWCGDRASDI